MLTGKAARGRWPASTRTTCPAAQAAAAGLGYRTVAAGQSFGLLVAVPQGEAAPRGFTLRNPLRPVARPSILERADLPYDRFTVPDPAVQALFDSCIRNIYQAREIKDGRPAFQVGPTCYRGTWAADGPFILEAITYLGRADEVRAGLEQQVTRTAGRAASSSRRRAACGCG